MATVDSSLVLTQLNERVNEQLKAVTCKWLARHHQMPINLAKQLLFAFVEQQGERVTPTYLLSGIAKDTGAMVVQLVPATDLQQRRATYTRLDCLHVYGVQPKVAVQDTSALWNSDLDQSETLYRTFLSADSTTDESGLLDKAVSAVRCTEATWTAHPGPRLPLKQIGGTTHGTPADRDAPAPLSKGAQSAPAATTKGSLWTNSTTAKGSSKAASAAAQPTAKGSSKAASAAAQPTAKAGKRRLLVDTDDEEEGQEAAVPTKATDNVQVTNKGPSQVAKKSGKASKASKTAPSPGKGTRNAVQAAQGAKPTGSAPAAEKGGKKRRKVLKTHINDKGEEETVVEWIEEEGEDSGAAAAAGDASLNPPQPAAPPKPVGKQAKKGAAKQSNITAFFGKK